MLDEGVIAEVDQPRWILDRRNSGSLYWRRDHIAHHERVKFRFDVQVKEFNKFDHVDVPSNKYLPPGALMVCKSEKHPLLGMSAFVCVMLTIFLPWYMMLLGVATK